MKVKDLRVGNVVSVDASSKCGIDNSILPKKITVTDLADGLKGLNPIDLTPEILLKCDFKEGNEGYYFKNGLEINIKEFIMQGWGYCDIKYLHQLQNLYFALTGEELIFNL